MSLLEVEGLEAGYGDLTVLRDISFTVNEGQVVTILGPNGAGKSTTLRALSGMVRRSGRVDFDGEDISSVPPDKIARAGIAHVPEGRGTFTGFTVEENLRVGAFPRSNGSDIREDMDRMLEHFPVLRDRRGQQAGNLSGGEQQMLAVARALMLRPRLMLLDEPSLGLAPKITRELFTILQGIVRDEGVTLLVVEQNANLVLRFADYAYVLEAGTIATEGDADKLAGDDSIRKAYLG